MPLAQMSSAQVFTTLAIITFAGVILACVIIVTRPPRGQTTDKRTKRGTSARQARREAELADLRQADADKPPYQPPTPGLPETAGFAAIRKLPGQDRLTRDPGTGMDVAPAWAADHLSGGGSPSQRLDPTLAQDPPPPLRSTDPPLAQQAPTASGASSPAPTHPATTAMPAVARPAVPGAPAAPHEAPLAPAAPRPAPPAEPTGLLPLMNHPRETRADRRRRLERENQNRPESP